LRFIAKPAAVAEIERANFATSIVGVVPAEGGLATAVLIGAVGLSSLPHSPQNLTESALEWPQLLQIFMFFSLLYINSLNFIAKKLRI
jgi:hypothetical protein